MVQRPALPVPVRLLAAELVSTLLLALGLMLHFDPGMAGRMGLPSGIGLPMTVFGALGLISCAVAIVRHVMQRRAASPRLPH